MLSPDLSIELSYHEEELPSLDDEGSEEEEEEEEEELPSFLMQVDKSKREQLLQGVDVGWNVCKL